MNTARKHLPTVARVLLGLVFVVFGLNGFLQFIPQPPPPQRAAEFGAALAASGYLFPLLKSLEIAAGAALLANRFVPLALTVLAPIVVNIVAFHLFLAPAGTPIAVVLVALGVFLAWAHRDAFRGVLGAKSEPRVGADAASVSGGRVRAARDAHA